MPLKHIYQIPGLMGEEGHSGKGKFQTRTIDVGSVIETHVSLFTVSLPKNVTLDTHLPSTPVFVNGNPGQIEQVIMNMIINGGEAIGEKQGVVYVTLTDVTMHGNDLLRFGVYTNTPNHGDRYALREIQPGVKIVITSGYSEEEVTKKLDAVAVSGFIQKPYRLQALTSVVKTAME